MQTHPDEKTSQKTNGSVQKIICNALLVRYAEIGLKGRNRPVFEGRLIKNIGLCLQCNKIQYEKILNPRGRIIVIFSGEGGIVELAKEAAQKLKNIFGISSLSPAVRLLLDIENEIDGINSIALIVYNSKLSGINNRCDANKEYTFRISTQRLNKNFRFTSQQTDELVGEFIANKTGAKVKLKNPDINLGIEIINNSSFLFTEKIPGLGGLPVGTQGSVELELKTKQDIAACYLMLKRGCDIFTGDKIPEILKKYSYGTDFRAKNPIAGVSSALLNELPRTKQESVLYPMVGYSKKQAEAVYSKI